MPRKLDRRDEWQAKQPRKLVPQEPASEGRRCDVKALEAKQHIAFKNILFATDLDISARRALPFAVGADRRPRAEY